MDSEQRYYVKRYLKGISTQTRFINSYLDVRDVDQLDFTETQIIRDSVQSICSQSQHLLERIKYETGS